MTGVAMGKRDLVVRLNERAEELEAEARGADNELRFIRGAKRRDDAILIREAIAEIMLLHGVADERGEEIERLEAAAKVMSLHTTGAEERGRDNLAAAVEAEIDELLNTKGLR